MPLSNRRMIMLGALSGCNVAAGAVLQLSVVLLLGASGLTDAYFAAQALPMVASAILTGALVNNLTPLLAAQVPAQGDAMARHVSKQLALPILLLVLVASATAKWWAPGLFKGLEDLASRQLVSLVPWLFLISGLNIVAAVYAAGLTARGKFAAVEFRYLLITALSLVAVAPATQAFGVAGFAGVLLSRAILLIICLGAWAPTEPQLVDADLSTQFWRRVRETLSGSMLFRLGPVVDRALASNAFPGAITAIGVGQQATGAVAGLTDKVLTRPLLVSAGSRVNTPSQSGIVELYRRQLRIVAACASTLLGISLLAGWLGWHYGWLAGLDESRLGRLDLLILVVLTAIPNAASQLSSSLVYAAGNAKAVSRIAMCSFLVSTAVKVFGFMLFGLPAIIAGMFLYQALNWWLFHIEGMRALGAVSR